MNAQLNTTKSTALFGLLLAVSAFNLSALPDSEVTVVTRTISSVDSCNLRDELGKSETPNAACTISAGKTTGKLKLTRRDSEAREWSDDGEKSEVKKTSQWELTLETECTTGCENGVRTIAKSNFSSLKDLADKVREQKAEFKKEVDRADKEEREKKELAEKKNNCELDANGKEFASEDKVLSCKVGRLSKMESREKAAELFQTEIQPKLQAMLTCDQLSGSGAFVMPNAAMNMQNNGAQCTADRNKAAKLLQQISKSAGNNPYIQQATTNLNAFGYYAVKMDALSLYSRYSQDPQAKQAIQQQMQQLQGQWGGYFASQGLAINNMHAPMDWNSDVLDFRGGLASNLTSYNQSFTNLALQHQQMLGLNTNVAANNAASAQGRLMRGQVAGLPQAPNTVANGQPVVQQQASAIQPVNALNANRATPTPGGTVNIIKPQFAGSVR